MVKKCRDDRGHGTAGALRPQEHGERRDPEEGQDAESGNGEDAVIVIAVAEDEATLQERIVCRGQPFPGERDGHRRHDARNRGMLRIPGIRAVEPLHPAAEVARFVHGVAEDGIGGYDPRGRDEYQQDCEDCMAAAHWGFPSWVPIGWSRLLPIKVYGHIDVSMAWNRS